METGLKLVNGTGVGTYMCNPWANGFLIFTLIMVFMILDNEPDQFLVYEKPANVSCYFCTYQSGKGSSDESIEDIQSYEEEFFRHSKLFREGALRPHQTTTQNLARAVSQEFWKLVRESVQQQAEVIRADLSKKELEWKNTYKGRMMTRVSFLVRKRTDIGVMNLFVESLRSRTLRFASSKS